MKNPKNKACLDTVKIGNVLYITSDRSQSMRRKDCGLPITNIGIYVVLDIRESYGAFSEKFERYFLVRSRCEDYFSQTEPVRAVGTLVRIKKRKR